MESMSLSYVVSVSGLDQVKAQADSAARSVDLASSSVKGLQSQGVRTMPLMLNALQTVNSLRSSVEYASKALETLSPESIVSALISAISVVTNLIQVMRLLRESTTTAAAAQAVLNTLAGAWWLIPLAVAAGAMVAQSIRSMQVGGPVRETGVYLLHRGEYVVPAPNVTSIGPVYVALSAGRGEHVDVDGLVKELGPRLARQLRRAAP